MGATCSSAKHAEDLELLERVQAEREELRLRCLAQDESLRGSEERGNMLRFKIEVMVQMLAVEEKQNESLLKRLEASKFLALSHGITEKTMNGLLEGGEGPSSSSLHSLLMSVDLHGAITRMYQEMDARPEEIVGSFADSEERVSATMELEEFTKHLFSITEQLSKTDAALLAIRFFDGELVSIPDFLEFFISTPTSRRAKASAAAVRVGLNLLELQQSATKGGPEYDGSEEEDGELDKSKTCVWTTELHKAVRKLRAIFPQVDAALTLALDEEAEENEGNNNKAEIITASAFKSILHSICGSSSNLARKLEKGVIANKKRKSNEKIKLAFLSENDIRLLAERFTDGAFVQYSEFLRFFRDGKSDSAASPFVLTAEWNKLKTSVSMRGTNSFSETQKSSFGESRAFSRSLKMPALARIESEDEKESRLSRQQSKETTEKRRPREEGKNDDDEVEEEESKDPHEKKVEAPGEEEEVRAAPIVGNTCCVIFRPRSSPAASLASSAKDQKMGELSIVESKKPSVSITGKRPSGMIVTSGGKIELLDHEEEQEVPPPPQLSPMTASPATSNASSTSFYRRLPFFRDGPIKNKINLF